MIIRVCIKEAKVKERPSADALHLESMLTNHSEAPFVRLHPSHPSLLLLYASLHARLLSYKTAVSPRATF